MDHVVEDTESRPVAPGGWLATTSIAAVTGIDHLAWSLAVASLLFSGPLLPALGIAFGAVLLGSAAISLLVAWRSGQRNSLAAVQEITIPPLAVALTAMAARMPDAGIDEKAATALAIVGASSLLTGAILWTVGRLRLGGLARFLPYPVIAGFLAGSGWLLVEGGLMLLADGAHGSALPAALIRPDALIMLLPAMALGAGLVFVLGRYANAFVMPGILLACGLGFYLALAAAGIEVSEARSRAWIPDLSAVGRVSLPSPVMLAQVNWSEVAAVLPVMLTMALLTIIGVLLHTSAVELAVGSDLDANQELRAAGIANCVAGLAGCPSGYANPSPTLLAEKLGVRGRRAGVASALAVLVGIYFAESVLSAVPVFITAGLVFFFGFELLLEWVIHSRSRLTRTEWLVVPFIVIVMGVAGFLEGLMAGLAVSIVMFVVNYARLPVIRLSAPGHEIRSLVDRSAASMRHLRTHGTVVEIVQLQGYLFFGSAERIVAHVRQRINDDSQAGLRFLILDFSHASGADSAAASCFLKVLSLAEQNAVQVFLCEVSAELLQTLQRVGLTIDGTLCCREPDIDHALERCEEELLADEFDPGGEVDLVHQLNAVLGAHPRVCDLAGVMEMMHLHPGEMLVRAGETSEDIFIVSKGRVTVQRALTNGRVVRIRTMTGGAVIGEIGLYLNQERTADVLVEDTSVVHRMKASTLARLTDVDAELAALFHRLMAISLAEKMAFSRRVADLSSR